MEVLDVVAEGEGWFLHKQRGRLHLVIAGQEFVARPKALDVQLPEGFVTEFFRAKKAIRKADEDDDGA